MRSNILNSEEAVIKIQPSAIYSILIAIPYILAPLVGFILLQVFLHEKIITPSTYKYIVGGRPFILISLGLSVYGILKAFIKTAITFYVSDQQIKVERGLFSKHIDYLELYRVKDYIVDIPFIYRFFNIMDFTVLSVDENWNNKRITMPGIKNTDIQTQLRSLVQQARLDNNIYGIESQPL